MALYSLQKKIKNCLPHTSCRQLPTAQQRIKKQHKMDRLEYLEKLVKDMSCKIADLETAQHTLADKPVAQISASVGRVLQTSFDTGDKFLSAFIFY
jgi:hypothetical protein